MEEFYNMIRQWYVPTKHAGLFPPKVEEMYARQVGIWHEPSVLGSAFMHTSEKDEQIRRLTYGVI